MLSQLYKPRKGFLFCKELTPLITDGEIMDYFNELPEDQREATVKTLLAHKLIGDNFLHD